MPEEMIYIRGRGWVSLAELEAHLKREERLDHLKLGGFMSMLVVLIVLTLWK